MKKESGAALFDLLLSLDRRIFTIAHKLRPQAPLGLREGFVLAEISQHSAADHDLLRQTLGISDSVFSKLLRTLTARGLIEKKGLYRNNRSSLLQVTARGRKLFLIDNQARNQQILELTYPLLQQEKVLFASFVDRMATQLQATPAMKIPGDPPCKAEIFRLIPALGILGDSFLGLTAGLLEVQILHLLTRNGDCVSEETLSSLLPIKKKIMADQLQSLVRSKLVKKHALSFDRRNHQIVLTAKGRKRALGNISNGSSCILAALKGCSAEQYIHFRFLLEKLVYCDFNPLLDLQSHQLRVERIETNEKLDLARAFVIEQLVEVHKHQMLHDTVLEPKSLSYQLLQLEAINGVCEIRKRGAAGELIHFVMFVDIHDPVLPGELLIRAAEDCFLNQGLRKLVIAGESEAKTFVQQGLGQSVSELTPQGLMTLKSLHAKLQAS